MRTGVFLFVFFGFVLGRFEFGRRNSRMLFKHFAEIIIVGKPALFGRFGNGMTAQNHFFSLFQAAARDVISYTFSEIFHRNSVQTGTRTVKLVAKSVGGQFFL